jgi:hypothetical protein
LNKVTEWKAQCSSNQVANSVQEAENLLKKHHELSDDISQIYAEVIFNIFKKNKILYFYFSLDNSKLYFYT